MGYEDLGVSKYDAMGIYNAPLRVDTLCETQEVSVRLVYC